MLMQDITLGDFFTLIVVIIAVIQLFFEFIADLLKADKKK